VRLLVPRSLSVEEVRRRLHRKGYPASEIDETVGDLVARGYLNDPLLAYNVATSLAVRRLFGKARIAAELRRRGVAGDIIAEALERAFAEVDEDELALKAAGRHATPVPGPGGESARGRIARALLRRGFSGGTVSRTLRRLSAEHGTRNEQSAPVEPAQLDAAGHGDELDPEEVTPENDDDDDEF